MMAQQIRMLGTRIAQTRPEQLQEYLAQIGYGVPPEYMEEIAALAETIEKEAIEQQKEEEKKRMADADQLVADAKKACLTAKTSDELNPILLRCSELQNRRQNQNGAFEQRIQEKIQGVNELLRNWMQYLDQKAIGNTSTANYALKNMTEHNGRFPILSVEEISARIVREPDPLQPAQQNPEQILAKVWEGIDSLAKLEIAQKRINENIAALEKDSSRMQIGTLQRLREEKAKIDNCAHLNETLQTREAATNLLRNGEPRNEPRTESLSIANLLYWKALEIIAATSNGPAKEKNESSEAYVTRVLNDFEKAEKYGDIANILRASYCPRGYTSSETRLKTDSLSAIDGLMAAQRMEDAGDFTGAITAYRSIVALPLKSYVPTKQAEAKLKALIAAHPDIAKDSNLELSAELKRFRMEMQSTMREQMMRSNR